MRVSTRDGSYIDLSRALTELSSAMRSNTTPDGVIYDLQTTFDWDRPNRNYPRVITTCGGSIVEVVATVTGLVVTI